MNPKDTITLDVPLFIRLLEYAREDAKTDMDLHNVAERAINLSTEGECLGMQNYDSLVGQTEKLDESFLRMQKMAGIITEEEYLAEIKKDIPKGTQITYAKGKQPEKTAYMVEYTNHPYSQDWCMVSNSEDLTEPFLVAKRWIK
jgi:hypothetical protein